MAVRISRRNLLASSLAAGALPLLRTRTMAQTAPLRIGTTFNEASAPMFYAADQGFFKRSGLNVEVLTLQNGPAVAAALSGGSLDIGGSSTFVFMNAFRHGLPYTIVEPGELYRSEDVVTAMCVAANSPVTSARDLNGKTIAGISLGGIDQLSTMLWMDQNGGDSRTIKFVESPSSGMADGLEADRFAAALIIEPHLSAAGNRLRILAKPYDTVAKRFMVAAWFATNDWAAKNADTIARLNETINQAAAWGVANPERARASLEKWTKVKVDRTRMHFADKLDASLIQPICDAALKYKMIDAPLDARTFFWNARKQG